MIPVLTDVSKIIVTMMGHAIIGVQPRGKTSIAEKSNLCLRCNLNERLNLV